MSASKAQVDGPHPLNEQARVLGESLGNKVSEGKCVLVHVEVGEDILLDHGRHLHPLLFGGVHARGVASERVQEDERTLENFDVLHGFGEFEAVIQRFNTMQNVIKVSNNSPAN